MLQVELERLVRIPSQIMRNQKSALKQRDKLARLTDLDGSAL